MGTVDGRAVWSAEHALRSIDESLARLRTDYVDVLQLHNPKPDDLESTGLLDALLEIQRQGKARWIGISTNLPYLPSHAAVDAFDVFQTSYSTLQPEHASWITRLTEDGRGTIVRTRAAKGEPDIVGSLAHSRGIRFATDEERWANFEKANLDELREEGENRAAFNLRYTFAHPDISTVIVGALDPAHVRENVRMLEKGALSRPMSWPKSTGAWSPWASGSPRWPEAPSESRRRAAPGTYRIGENDAGSSILFSCRSGGRNPGAGQMPAALASARIRIRSSRLRYAHM